MYVFWQNLGYFVFVRRVKSSATFFNSTKPNALTQPRPSRMPFLSGCIDNPLLSSLFQAFRYSSDVFERRMSTGSERFSFLICLDATKFVLLSVFTLIETICPKICSKSRLKGAKKNNFRLTSLAPRSCCLSSPIGDGTKRGKQETQRGVALHIIKTNFNKSRLPVVILFYVHVTLVMSRVLF